MEVVLGSAANDVAVDLARLFLSMVLDAGKSLHCLQMVMGSFSEEINSFGTMAETTTGLLLAVKGKNKAVPENKDAGDSEDDDDEDDEDDDDDGGDDSGDDNEGEEEEDGDPEANGEGGSDEDGDEDDDDDDDDEDEDDDEEDDEDEDEETPQPPSKKRK